MAAPANDACADATVISSLPYSDSIDTTEATASGDPTPSGGAMGHTVWYKWIATFDGRVAVSTVFSDFESALAIFSGTCGSLVEVAYNDDVAPQTWAGTDERVQAETAFTAVSGTTYYFMVGSDDSEDGGNLVFRVWGETASGLPALRQQKTITSSFGSIEEEDNLGNYWYPGVQSNYDGNAPNAMVRTFYAYNVLPGTLTFGGITLDSDVLAGSLVVLLYYQRDSATTQHTLVEFTGVSTVRPLQARAYYESAASGITSHVHAETWDPDPNVPEGPWPEGQSSPGLLIALNASQQDETASDPSGYTAFAFNGARRRGYYRVTTTAETPVAAFTTTNEAQIAAGIWAFAAPSSSSSRNFATGFSNAITGNDNVVTGTHGELIGDVSVLHNLDGVTRSKTKDRYFGVFADEIELDAPTLTLPDESVTYAKIQNVSAASRLLGRGSASGAGDVEEISLGSGLSMSGTTLSAPGSGGDGDATLTAAYGSRPSADNPGDLFFPSDGFVVERASDASPSDWVPWGPIFPFIDPTVLAPTTWVNQGSSTVANGGGGVVLTGAATGSGAANIVARVKTAPSAPYVITACFHVNILAKAFQGAGLCFRQSSDGKLHVFHLICGTSFAMVSAKYTSATAFSADYVNINSLGDRLLFLRIADNNTSRICSFSADGQNWTTFHTVGRTDFLTADQVGFHVSTENSATPNFAPILTLLSWDES